MIHPLSLVSNSSLPVIERFHGMHIDIDEDDGIKLSDTPSGKLKVFSTNAVNNYGPLLNMLPSILPDVYIKTDDINKSDVCNKNTGLIGWYIDGMEEFILKENLVRSSRYSIMNIDSVKNPGKDPRKDQLYISKPSHLYVGSGKYILIGTKKEVLSRRKEEFKGETLKWIVQPLLTNVMLWHDRYKFDLRLFATIFTYDNGFYAACYKIGVGRCCVNPHDPKRDPLSAITNISVQEKISGYDAEFHLPLVYDDKHIGKIIIGDILHNVKLTLDPRKKCQILILGLDVILLDDGSFRLIEVNHNPSLEYRPEINNNEKIASMGFILGLYGHIIPLILRDKPPVDSDDWDFV